MPNKIRYYPYKVIGKGAYKHVFNITSNLDAINIKDDVLTREERMSMSIMLEKQISANVVMIRPIYVIEDNPELIDELKEFVHEMKLQKKFAGLGLAPKVLKVNMELRNEIGYTPYAYTYRCNFNLCNYDFGQISNDLKKLFDRVAETGYIYTDIKNENICEIDQKFMFVDFHPKFVYQYKGFKTGLKKPTISKKEVISDIMEFMFISI